MRRARFSRGGLALSVARCGDGGPMLFQHGLGGDAAQAAEVFPQGIGWQAVTLECHGHGRSEAGPPEGLLRFAAPAGAHGMFSGRTLAGGVMVALLISPLGTPAALGSGPTNGVCPTIGVDGV